MEPLIGPDTVNTLPPETLEAYRDHGDPASRLTEAVDRAASYLQRLPELGIDLNQATQQLEDEGVEKFNQPFDSLMATLEAKRREVLSGRQTVSATPITHLFLDIGGVLLTNGWDRHCRRDAAQKFGLDFEDLNDRHTMSFDTYEEGKLNLDTYLNQVVFNRERPFTREDFKEFMFAQSKPKVEMINLVSGLKWKHRLKTAAISNEGRELTILPHPEVRSDGFH